ncbi:glycosyltransferase [Acidimangrovimonas pyrenivorans]|uniref:Glycosyltransferase n=1 Tax=Acidimangrovimonas pyrenivorans TaxID=2030798 RepID=A0ABV7AMK6_9RHOB
MDARQGQGAGSLVAVVVTHERLDKLRVTLARLLQAPAEQLGAVVVVDNASADETPAFLASQDDPRVTVLRNRSNLGGAGGFERGLREAVARFDPDWIVVMDDDARPAPGALAAFHALKPGDDTAVAAAVHFPDGRVCEMNRPSINPFWHPRAFLRGLRHGRDGYHIPYEAYDGDKPLPIDLTSFVGLFLSRRMIREVGLPEGRLFLYGDDVIYTLRLRRAGFFIDFEPRVRFEHACETFENDQFRVFRPLWKVYYTYRNGLMMYRKAAGPLFWALLPVVTTKWLLAARRYHGADRRAYMRLLRRAIRDAVRDRTDLSHDEVKALARRSSAR